MQNSVSTSVETQPESEPFSASISVPCNTAHDCKFDTYFMDKLYIL